VMIFFPTASSDQPTHQVTDFFFLSLGDNLMTIHLQRLGSAAAAFAPAIAMPSCLTRGGRLGTAAATGRRCISFALTPREEELQNRVREFVAEKVIPHEQDVRRTSHGPTDGLRNELVGLAREAGLLSGLPDMQAALKSQVTRAVVFEAAGYSMLGPIALNIAAPTEGAPRGKWAGRRIELYTLTSP